MVSDPRLIFSLIIGAPIVLTLCIGSAIGLTFYFLDRALRATQRSAAPSRLRPAGDAPQVASTASPTFSPLTRLVLAGGQVEVGPAMGLPNTKLGMWTFLASEVMFFTALIAAFVAFKARGMLDGSEALNMPLAALNTFILIVSSFTVVLALDAIQRGHQTRFVMFILATLALGSTFIAFQGVEWNLLLSEGITPANRLFGTAFFVLTGFHGAHVISGLLWLVTILLRAFRGDFTPQRYLGYEVFGLYWHFVDIVWIVLFTVIYLI
mgnify:CR=1 FL=1